MSFFDDASLAFLPSGGAGKDTKAYSIKPTDGTGDFTFSRGSNLAATRVGPTGLIEKGRENLILQSNQFDTTPWLLNTTSATSGQSGYDGTTDAWFLNSTGTGFPRVQQNVATSGVFVFSVYAKAATDGFMLIRTFGADAQVWFDLSDGSISNEAGAQYISSTIENIGNGWYRYSVLVNGSLTSVRIYPASAYGVYSTSGNGIYIQDSQVEVGALATEVIESGATTGKAGLLEDEPRFDYSGGATCPSLLLEPSRTQSITQSEYFEPSATDWRSEGNNGVTITTNDTTSPEGLVNASKLQGGGASNDRLQLNFNTSNTKAVYSLFVKGTGDAVRFSIFNSRSGDRLNYDIDTSGNFTLNQATGTTNYDIEDYGNGWYRIWAEFTTDAALTNYFQIYSDINGSGAVYLYGVQLEDNASYPTSYIPNHSGGTITRGEDACVLTGASSIIGQTSGSIYFEFNYEYQRPSSYLFEARQDANNKIYLLSLSDFNLRFRGFVGGVGQFSVSTSSIPAEGVHKACLTYEEDNFAFYLDGVLVGTATSGLISTTDELEIFTNNNDTNQFLLFDSVLSSADAITLTTL